MARIEAAEKKCVTCARTLPIEHFYDDGKGKHRRMPRCKECYLLQKRERRKEKIAQGICGRCMQDELLPNGALCQTCWFKQTAIPRMGSVEKYRELQAKFEEQRGVCPYTGRNLVLGLNTSLDHIRPVSLFPELKDDLDNLVFVDTSANLAKNTLSVEEFKQLVIDLYATLVSPDGGNADGAI